MRFTTRLAALSCAVALATWTLGVAAQDHDHDADQHAAGAHTHPEAAKIQNPVKVTPASVAAGEKIYTAQCVACHGAAGKGDGKMAAQLDPKPADLTDAGWKHGSSDGEIFTLIKDGSKNTGMKGFGAKLTANDMWNIVNYLRSIGPKSPPAH